MTDDELSELERLRRERDEAVAKWEESYGQALGLYAHSLCRGYANALDAAAPLLIAEVRRLNQRACKLEAALRDLVNNFDGCCGFCDAELPCSSCRMRVDKAEEALKQ